MSACIEKIIRLRPYNSEKNQGFSGGCFGIIFKFWVCINCEPSSDDMVKTKREMKADLSGWLDWDVRSTSPLHKEQRVGPWEQMPCLDLSCAEVGECGTLRSCAHNDCTGFIVAIVQWCHTVFCLLWFLWFMDLLSVNFQVCFWMTCSLFKQITVYFSIFWERELSVEISSLWVQKKAHQVSWGDPWVWLRRGLWVYPHQDRQDPFALEWCLPSTPLPFCLPAVTHPSASSDS